MHDEIERIRSSMRRKPRGGGGGVVQHLPSTDLKVLLLNLFKSHIYTITVDGLAVFDILFFSMIAIP